MLAKQSTARTFLLGPILDSAGAAKTDEVVASIKVTKNGTVGAVDAQDTLTHNHTGHYVFVSDGGDFDTLGEVIFSLNSGTNAMAPVVFQVVTANVYDSFCSTDLLDVSLTQLLGTALSESAGTGKLAGALVKLLNVATPTGTVNSLPDAVAGAANGLLVSGANAGTTTLGALAVTGTTTLSGVVSAPAANSIAGTLATVTNLTNAPTNGDLTATMKTSVNTEADTALSDIKLDHLIAVAESGDVVNSSIIAKIASKSATPAFSSYNNTTDSMEAQADVLIDIHGTDLPAVKTDTAAIKLKTDLIPAIPASQGDVTAVGTVVSNIHDTDLPAVKTDTAAIKLKTDLIPAIPASQGDVTSVGSLVTTVDGVVDAIKLKTDLIPAIPASRGDVTTVGDLVTAVGSLVTTVDGVVDTIKVTADKLDTALVLDGAVYKYTANALEDAPSGGLTQQQVRDAMRLDSTLHTVPPDGSIDHKLDTIPADTIALMETLPVPTIVIDPTVSVTTLQDETTHVSVEQLAGRPNVIFNVKVRDSEGVLTDYDLSGKVVKLVIYSEDRETSEKTCLLQDQSDEVGSDLTVGSHSIELSLVDVPAVTANAGNYKWTLWEINAVTGDLSLGTGDWFVNENYKGSGLVGEEG